MQKHSTFETGGPNEYKGRDGFNAHDQTKINITGRDRLMRAWEDCMEHARDYSKFSEIYRDSDIGQVFGRAAEAQGICAAELHDTLLHYQQSGTHLTGNQEAH